MANVEEMAATATLRLHADFEPIILGRRTEGEFVAKLRGGVVHKSFVAEPQYCQSVHGKHVELSLHADSGTWVARHAKHAKQAVGNPAWVMRGGTKHNIRADPVPLVDGDVLHLAYESNAVLLLIDQPLVAAAPAAAAEAAASQSAALAPPSAGQPPARAAPPKRGIADAFESAPKRMSTNLRFERGGTDGADGIHAWPAGGAPTAPQTRRPTPTKAVLVLVGCALALLRGLLISFPVQQAAY